MLIDANEVRKTFMKCLFNDDEIIDGKFSKEAVLIDGVMAKYGFHPIRLEESRKKVTEWCESLPDDFRESVGGGTSFLMAAHDREGNHWAEHPTIDNLFCLAMGLSLARYCLPREMWKVLPGGMPYITYIDQPKNQPTPK